MARTGEENVRNFFTSLGLDARKIPVSSIKTPDFEVYLNNDLVFYCEEKTLEIDDFEGCKNDPTYNSISKHIHEAAKQLKSVNPDELVPNVVAFTNFETSRDAHDLFITLTGCAELDDGKYLPIHRVGRVSGDLKLIDLYLWFQGNKLTNCIWSGINTNHEKKLRSFFECMPY